MSSKWFHVGLNRQLQNRSDTSPFDKHIWYAYRRHISYYYINQSLIDWDLKMSNNYNFINYNIIDGINISAKLNTTYIELLTNSLLDNQLIAAGWNFIQWSTNQQIHTFQHDLCNNLTFQSLHASLFEYLHSICVLDYLAQVLSVIVIIIILFLWINRNGKITILF